MKLKKASFRSFYFLVWIGIKEPCDFKFQVFLHNPLCFFSSFLSLVPMEGDGISLMFNPLKIEPFGLCFSCSLEINAPYLPSRL